MRIQTDGARPGGAAGPACRRAALRTILCALAAIITAPASAQTKACTLPPALNTRLTSHPGPEAYAEAANWFGQHQRYGCAASTLRSGLARTPASAPLLYLLGLNLYAGGEPDQALQPLQQSVQLAPAVLPPHLLLATVLDKLHQAQAAEGEWKAAYAIDPHSALALDGLARARINAGDPTNAIELLRAAPHELVLQDEDLELDLGRAYGSSRLFDQAAAVLTEALKLHPDSFRLNDGLETILVFQTQYLTAAAVAERYAARHPHDIEAQRLYLRLLVLNHNAAAAIPLARKLLAAAPHDFDFLYLSGILERDAGDYASALDHLQQAVALDPNQSSARYNLGATLAALKDYAGAREQFEKAITLGAQAPEVRFAYANTLRGLGETELARQQLVLYQQAQKDQAARAVSAGKAAQASQALAAGDAAKAAALDREALAATPADAQLAYQLSLALRQAGDPAGEQAALEQTVSIDPTFAIAEYQLGLLATQRDEKPTAETYFRKATQAAPAYTAAWIRLASVLATEARPAEARQALAAALALEPRNPAALELQTRLDTPP